MSRYEIIADERERRRIEKKADELRRSLDGVEIDVCSSYIEVRGANGNTDQVLGYLFGGLRLRPYRREGQPHGQNA